MFARISTFAGTAVIAAGLGLAAFAGAATASAADVDAIFLDDISSYDIAFESAGQAISDAHDVCAALDVGVSHTELTDEVWINSGLNYDQANYFVEAAELAYCPEYF